MAEEPAVIAAQERIESALNDFVCNNEKARANVGIDAFGHLHALIVCRAFEGIAEHSQRKALVRDYLRNNVAPEDLAYLHKLFTLSGREARRADYVRQVSNGLELESLVIPMNLLDGRDD